MVSGPPRESLPRVLVAGGPPFNSTVGAGVTLSGLFGGWPRDRLADAYEGDLTPDPAIAGRFYPLTPRHVTGRNKWTRQARLLGDVVTGRADSSVLIGRVSPALHEFVREFRPEAIFLELSSLSAIDIVLALATHYRIPYAVHVPDDWMPSWPRYAFRSAKARPAVEVLNWRLRRRLRPLMAGARAHFAISDSLGATLSSRYGVPFRTAYNAVDPAGWPDVPPRDPPPGVPVRVVYSGSVFSYGQSESLADVARAVSRLHGEGVPVRLDVYTQHHEDAAVRASLAPGAAVGLYPLVPREALGENLRDADVLLLPVNFDAMTHQFIRYSMPGKMAEYLMAGRALLAYGPPDVEQTRFVQAHDCAYLVPRRDPRALEAALRLLATDAALRAGLGARARRTGLDVFDLREVRAAFESAMVDLVRRGR